MEPTERAAGTPNSRQPSPPVLIELGAPHADVENDPKPFTPKVPRNTPRNTVQSPRDVQKQRPQRQVVRKRRRILSNGQTVDVIEVHHHHHHIHPSSTTVMSEPISSTAPVAAGAAFPDTPQFMMDPMGDIHPMPIGGGTWSNPVPQISFQQSTIQNKCTIILGCIICPIATFICIILWLAAFGIIAITDVFGNPW